MGYPLQAGGRKLPRGGQPPGEDHPRAVLTDGQVINIRYMLEHMGIGVCAVARFFGVTHQHVSNIRLRKRRRNV